MSSGKKNVRDGLNSKDLRVYEYWEDGDSGLLVVDFEKAKRKRQKELLAVTILVSLFYVALLGCAVLFNDRVTVAQNCIMYFQEMNVSEVIKTCSTILGR